jgi:hypothetical protein
LCRLVVLAGLPPFFLAFCFLFALVVAQHILDMSLNELSRLTLARVSGASMCTTSAGGDFCVQAGPNNGVLRSLTPFTGAWSSYDRALQSHHQH